MNNYKLFFLLENKTNMKRNMEEDRIKTLLTPEAIFKFWKMQFVSGYFEHSFMAEDAYIQLLSSMLYDFHNRNFEREYYEDIAWSGLFNTEVFQGKSRIRESIKISEELERNTCF